MYIALNEQTLNFITLQDFKLKKIGMLTWSVFAMGYSTKVGW